jgi:hypothetical protein
MTFFWIVFVLGVPYATAICGNFYAVLNPWLVLCTALERGFPGAFRARFTYPAARLGCYPALVLYMAFIWFELFGHATPRGLAVALTIYTAINLSGAALIGKQAWFRHGEFFAVFLRLIGMMAPVRVRVGSHAAHAGGRSDGPDDRRPDTVRAGFRAPCSGLLEKDADHISVAVFVLFMLASTAYDGMHESQPWAQLFWRDIFPLVGPALTGGSARPYVVAAQIFHHWQSLAVFLSPLVYLACYLAFLQLTRLVTGCRQSLGCLARRFAHTLVPIAFVYHLTHYYTLLLSQGPSFFRQISDPFGLGWNLFGTGSYPAAPVLIDASVIWHTQVGLILLGHVVSVYLAHAVALRTFRSVSRATLSQLPMLLLMVGLTAAGLWILSLPIASGQMAMPAAS